MAAQHDPDERIPARDVFAALLDHDRGGHVELRPTDPDTSLRRHYLQHTNQAETTAGTLPAAARVLHSLNTGSAGLATRCSDGVGIEVTHEQVAATCTVDAGERVVLGVVASVGDPLFLNDVGSFDHRVDLTVTPMAGA